MRHLLEEARSLLESAIKRRVYVSEIEHEGDLDNAKEDFLKSGLQLLEVKPRFREESAVFVASGPQSAWDRFSKTDAFGMSNLAEE